MNETVSSAVETDLIHRHVMWLLCSLNNFSNSCMLPNNLRTKASHNTVTRFDYIIILKCMAHTSLLFLVVEPIRWKKLLKYHLKYKHVKYAYTTMQTVKIVEAN